MKISNLHLLRAIFFLGVLTTDEFAEDFNNSMLFLVSNWKVLIEDTRLLACCRWPWQGCLLALMKVLRFRSPLKVFES